MWLRSESHEHVHRRRHRAMKSPMKSPIRKMSNAPTPNGRTYLERRKEGDVNKYLVISYAESVQLYSYLVE